MRVSNRRGSLTKNGVLNLSLNLINAPENVIDYVVLHELCRLKIKEHSNHYWDLLYKYMPNYLLLDTMHGRLEMNLA